MRFSKKRIALWTVAIAFGVAISLPLSAADQVSSNPPNVSAQLYQERVPGKPQEGFVPVPRNVSSVKYTQDTVRANGIIIKMMDDKDKGIKCYWVSPYREPQNLSCVKY